MREDGEFSCDDSIEKTIGKDDDYDEEEEEEEINPNESSEEEPLIQSLGLRNLRNDWIQQKRYENYMKTAASLWDAFTSGKAAERVKQMREKEKQDEKIEEEEKQKRKEERIKNKRRFQQ